MTRRWIWIASIAAAGAWPGGCSCSSSIRLVDSTPHVRTDPAAGAGQLPRPLETDGRLRVKAVLFTDIPESGIVLDEAVIVEGDSVEIELAGESSLDLIAVHDGETTLELTMGDAEQEAIVEVATPQTVSITPAALAGIPSSQWPSSVTMVAGSAALFEREAADDAGRLLTGATAITWDVDGDATVEPIDDAPALVRVVAGSSRFRLSVDDAELEVAVVNETEVVALQMWREETGWLADGQSVTVAPAAAMSVFVVPVTADGDAVVGVPDTWSIALDSPMWTSGLNSTCDGIECPARRASIYAELEPQSRGTGTVTLGPLSATFGAIVQ